MDITFSLQNGQYIAEFKVTSEFNLHIEKGVGSMQMLQRTSGTFFDKVEDFKMSKGDVVYDYDSSSFIGEKTIKIVSEVEPTFAAVTTSGEVTEIKSQSKEVEVTANGTMDIIPDAGFSYLNSVKVKTNVAGSGEGGEEGGNTYEYIDVRRPSDWQGEDFKGEVYTILVGFCACLVKINIESTQIVACPGALAMMGVNVLENVTAVAVDINMEVFADTGYKKVGDLIKELGADSLPRITKEEFYNLNA